jgi:hypothetical protein
VTTLRLVGVLLVAIACGHAMLPAARVDSALQGLLETAVERSLGRLAAADVCHAEPTVRFDLTNALGPLARALQGTGQGARLATLDAALCSAGRQALHDQGPWLAAEAQRLEAEHPEEVLAGAPGAATAAYRAVIEPEFRERFSAGLPAALDAAEVPDALAALRAAAESLPLPRAVSLDPEAALRERWPDAFFEILAEEEARVRDESGEPIARLAARRAGPARGEAPWGDR